MPSPVRKLIGAILLSTAVFVLAIGTRYVVVPDILTKIYGLVFCLIALGVGFLGYRLMRRPVQSK